MTEKKERVALTGQVRIPESLEMAMNVESASRNIYKYALVAEMWDAYKKLRSDPAEPVPSTDAIKLGPVVHYSPSTGQLPDGASPLESACVTRLIRLLRSTKPDLPEAAVAVLTQLDDLRGLYERQRDADAVHTPAASEAPRSSEFERQSASLKRSQDLIDEKLRGIRTLGEGTSARKDVHAGKPRKRR